MTTLLNTPLPELALKIAGGDVKARDIADAVIDQYEATGSSNNAYKTFHADNVRAAADAADQTRKTTGQTKALHGIPVAVKDLYGVTGYPTFAGTPNKLPDNWTVPGPVVTAVSDQSAIISGKTHTVEFAFGGLGVNRHWDTPRNPWDLKSHRVPGGSSSGAGVSLGCGTSMVALGTDTGGSVRIPASMTGNVGLKTTAGRWSLQGIVPLSPTLDTPGPLAKTVTDTAWAFGALDPAWGHAPSLMSAIDHMSVTSIRIGIARTLVWEDLSPGIEESVTAFLDQIAKAGARCRDIDMPEIEHATAMHRLGGVASAELDELLTTQLPESRPTLHESIASRISDGGDMSAREYLTRRRAIDSMTLSAASYFDDVDVIAMPAVAITPPKMSDVEKLEDYRAANFASLRNTNVANCLGLCAITIPAGLDKAGMPTGLMLMGRAMAEEQLLAAALAIETRLGTPAARLGTPAAKR